MECLHHGGLGTDLAQSVRRTISPSTIARMRGFEGADLDSLYQNLRTMDFSKDVLQGRESMLKVITVPHCGWTDLGTPERVGRILEGCKRLPRRRTSRRM